MATIADQMDVRSRGGSIPEFVLNKGHKAYGRTKFAIFKVKLNYPKRMVLQ